MHIKCRYFSRKNLATGGVARMSLNPIKRGQNWIFHLNNRTLLKFQKHRDLSLRTFHIRTEKVSKGVMIIQKITKSRTIPIKANLCLPTMGSLV